MDDMRLYSYHFISAAARFGQEASRATAPRAFWFLTPSGLEQLRLRRFELGVLRRHTWLAHVGAVTDRVGTGLGTVGKIRGTVGAAN